MTLCPDELKRAYDLTKVSERFRALEDGHTLWCHGVKYTQPTGEKPYNHLQLTYLLNKVTIGKRPPEG